MSVFHDGWSSLEDMCRDFDIDVSVMHDKTVLFASYVQESYEGYAFVLFRDAQDGQLYEVNGSHCSCFGLEGQWDPEPTFLAALENRAYPKEIEEAVAVLKANSDTPS